MVETAEKEPGILDWRDVADQIEHFIGAASKLDLDAASDVVYSFHDYLDCLLYELARAIQNSREPEQALLTRESAKVLQAGDRMETALTYLQSGNLQTATVIASQCLRDIEKSARHETLESQIQSWVM